jgi:Ser/Thr protein kinase RdoA (MazF antagonist)
VTAIHSQMKIQIDKSVAERIAEFYFAQPLAELNVLEGGYFASVFLLTLADQRKVVMKIAPDQEKVMNYEQQIIYAEFNALELLRRQGLPVPTVYTFDTSGMFYSDFLLLEFLEGQSYYQAKPHLSHEIVNQINQQIGQKLWSIHQLKSPTFGGLSPNAKRSISWREIFLGLFENALLDGEQAGVVLPWGYAQIRQEISALAYVFDVVTVPCLVLFDMWEGNILVNSETAKLTSIIDLERAFWADPLLEDQFRNLEPDPNFLLGYGSNPLETPYAHLRRSVYNVFLGCILVIECAYRKYTSPEVEQENRKYLVQELERFDRLRVM